MLKEPSREHGSCHHSGHLHFFTSFHSVLPSSKEVQMGPRVTEEGRRDVPRFITNVMSVCALVGAVCVHKECTHHFFITQGPPKYL